MTSSFSVVIPTFRRPDALAVTLGRILAVDYPADQLEVIVVDDGSGDDTGDLVARFAGGDVAVRLVEQRNRGAAAARNRGAEAAAGDFVLFLDDDILVEPGHLAAHLATQQQFDRALVAGEWRFTPEVLEELRRTAFGRYRIALEDSFRTAVPARPLAGECVELDVLPAADLSMRRELFWEIGGFDEAFPAAGAEDQDLSYRAREHGCRLVRNRAIRLLHNDAHMSLASFCKREERRAVTVLVLSSRFPASAAAVGYAEANAPISRSDHPLQVAKKLAKSAAAWPPATRALTHLIHALEIVHAPERVLRGAYSRLAGLYSFRGFRQALNTPSPKADGVT